MTVTITVLLVIALVHLIAALIGFADGVVRLLTAMIGLATKIIEIISYQ
jgi:hypothetical protein